MRIQLERKLSSCPACLRCVICRRMFEVPHIRTLLCNDLGFIQGDSCPECMKLEPEEIRVQLREQAVLLIDPSEENSAWIPSTPDRVLELLKCSEENLQFPSLYQWLIKWLELLYFSAQKSHQWLVRLDTPWDADVRSTLERIWRQDA